MEADDLWKAALRSARLSTGLGKRRVKLGVSHTSHSPRQRRNHSSAASTLILSKASSMSPVSVLDVSGTFNCDEPAAGRGD
jgi:hypothetical protein